MPLKEDISYETNSKEDILSLRKELIAKISKIWVYVHRFIIQNSETKDFETKWGIELGNIWGGRLTGSKLDQANAIIQTWNN
jgi:hypothetical protein